MARIAGSLSHVAEGHCRAECVRRVLNKDRSRLACKGAEARKICSVAAQMHRQDSAQSAAVDPFQGL